MSNKGGIGIELLSDPGNKLVLPEPTDGFPIGSALIAAASLIAGAVWTFFAIQGAAVERDPRLEIGTRVASIAVADMKTDLASEARLMADDARIRTTLATPEIDRRTVDDVLQDVMNAGGLSAIAVFDARGKALAAVGPKELSEIDLSVTRLTPGEGRLWSLSGKLMVVGTAPVQLGSELRSIVCAREVETAFVQRIAESVGTSVAIGMEGKVLLSAFVDPRDSEPIGEAIKRSWTGPASIGNFDVRVKELEASRRPILVATAAARRQRSSSLMWLPLVILAISGVASVVVANRR